MKVIVTDKKLSQSLYTMQQSLQEQFLFMISALILKETMYYFQRIKVMDLC